MHILSSEQFTPEMLGDIFNAADEFRKQVEDDTARRELAGRYTGEILANIFYAPSTRTRLSFDFAAQRLGMGVLGTEDAEQFSSAAKGETLEDSIRVIDEYGPAVIVIRHKQTGAADRAARVSSAPIFNAGDGSGEHPTQALLDAYTIRREKGRLDSLNVVFGGDLARGRTARSLTKLLAQFEGNRITFISTPELAMGSDVKLYIEKRGLPFSETDDLETGLAGADVIYWTRLQKERPIDGSTGVADSEEEPEQDPRFILGRRALELMPEDAIIMHPLPRVNEIEPSVDNDKRAVYFRQAGNGMYVRMALIDMVLRGAL